MFWVNDAWPIISTLQTNDVSSTRLHRFCSNLPFNELITSYKTTVMFSVSSVTFQWLGDVFIDVSVWNHELQIHSVHRPTACSVNHVLNTTWRQPVGKKNSEPDSLSCHNLWSHSVIGLPHSTSSWVDWASAAPQLSSRLCVRGSLGSITHFMLSGVSDTLQRWQYDWRGENQPSETFMCDISERQKMIFFLFSSSEPWKHLVLCDAVNTCDLSDPSFERQSYVTVCHEFGPIRCGYWFYSTSLKACWCGGQWKVQPPSEKLPCS